VPLSYQAAGLEHMYARRPLALSVVDASVMPTLVPASPNVPIMMMAAKAAAMWQGIEVAAGLSAVA